MQELSFKYKGLTFEPIGNILGGWKKKVDSTTEERKFDGLFDIKDFYKEAKKNHASCDVYKINDSKDLYMLCGSEKGCFLRVFNLTNLKKCEEYDKWYQRG